MGACRHAGSAPTRRVVAAHADIATSPFPCPAPVGPVPVGVNSFDFTASAPQPSLLPSTASEEILGVTVLILTGSYRDKEFVRVGYYVNTEYEDEARRLEPPPGVDFAGLIRNVLVEKPRVTRFNNPWDAEEKRAKGQGQGQVQWWPGAQQGQGQGEVAWAQQQGAQERSGPGPAASALPPPVTAQPAADARSAPTDVDMA